MEDQTNDKGTGADPGLEFGEGHEDGMMGVWGAAPRKIFRGHALQTRGKRGKRPFYLILIINLIT